ncbi:MAG: cysteine desulfurase NifS [Lachnospiraceae bacterium]|nr:cysteine desulfurase NifS [Lachnospiraceae bacterium]
MNKLIYLDNAATTAVKPEVVEAMLPYYCEKFGNASSIYSIGQESKEALENARQTIAGTLNAKTEEIYFTGCGTEADNWAIIGTAEAYGNKGKHIITSNVEHHAVLHTCEYLEKRGFEITYVPVDEKGLIHPEDVEAAIRPDTILITIMFANNEIGTIMPIAEIGAIAKKHGVLFHTDAVQAFTHLPIDVNALNIDMLSASGHKFHAPKGVGFLYIRKGLKLKSFIHGGAQERKRRAGTENVAQIVGMAKAAELAMANLEENEKKQTALRDHLISRVLTEIPHSRLNGDAEHRLPGNTNFSFQFIEGESMLMMLDMKGICGSSGSACTAGSLDPSHVLMAIGLPHEIAHGSLRLSLCEDNTLEEVDYTVDCLKEIVARLRAMSPLYEDFVKKQKK